MDIKETLDVFAAVESEADAMLSACADGKLTILDLRFELPVIPKLKAAFVNANLIKAELKQLDEVEVGQLVDRLTSVGAKVVQAFEAVTAIVSKG